MFKPIALKEISDFQISEDGLIANPQGIILPKKLKIYIRGKHYSVNRLVALTFLNRPSKKHTYVLFKDRNKTNLSASNLYWATKEELQKYRHKPIKKAVYQYTLEGELVAVYRDLEEAAATIFGKAHSIGKVCRNVYHTYLGYIWSYDELTDKKLKNYFKDYSTPAKRFSKRVAKIHPVTLEVIKVYDSLKLASDDNYVADTSISRATKLGNKAGGYYYKLVDRNGNLVNCK